MKMMEHSQVFYYLILQKNARVDIISGGIGQKEVSVLIEAKSVEEITYDVHFYASD